MFRTGSIVVLILATCMALLAAPVSANPPSQQSPTGFALSNARFQDYYDHRGGVATFGYPISREFSFLGSRVQFFQRAVMQLNSDGGVSLLNILDEGLLPYTHINNSTFPAPDPAVASAAPSPTDPAYAQKALAFLESYAPDEWDGMKVNFSTTFNSTVSYQDAFPNGDGEESLLPLINLEMWGLPISKPAYDPNNKNFVYLRFQRGIMHFDKTTGLTQGILIGDYLKSVITGQNLPVDLANDARSSRLYLQYNNAVAGGMNRPSELAGTDMLGAFEQDGVIVKDPSLPRPAWESPAPTAVAQVTQVPAQPTSQRITPPDQIAVAGDPWFIEQTNDAIKLLPADVRNYVWRIEETTGSPRVDYATHTIYPTEANAFAENWQSYREGQVLWYAGLIYLNSIHIEQYYAGRPYTGAEAEKEAYGRLKVFFSTREVTGSHFTDQMTTLLNNNDWGYGDWFSATDRTTSR